MSVAVHHRLECALATLEQRWRGKRRPKAFYLNASDWNAFIASDPPTIDTMFGNNPPRRVTDPAFRGVPVRESTSKLSRLYDHTTAGRVLPA
jgi:hypothetical protein